MGPELEMTTRLVVSFNLGRKYSCDKGSQRTTHLNLRVSSPLSPNLSPSNRHSSANPPQTCQQSPVNSLVRDCHSGLVRGPKKLALPESTALGPIFAG